MVELILQNSWILVVILIWTLPWKGVAMWKAARLGQKWWFIAILILNTLALLDIFYIFFVARKKTTDIIKK